MTSVATSQRVLLFLFSFLLASFHLTDDANAKRRHQNDRYQRHERCEDLLTSAQRQVYFDKYNQQGERYDTRNGRSGNRRRQDNRPPREQQPDVDQSASPRGEDSWPDQFGDIRDQIHAQMMKDHRNILTYRDARVHIMMQLDIKSDNQGHYVWDYYCQRGYRVRLNEMPDSNSLNIEHTWPQSRFNRRFSRDQQRSDMHHLFPTDSLANQMRGHLDFGLVVKDTQLADQNCRESRLGLDKANQTRFTPPAAHRGNVARAVFYFAIHYKIGLSREHEALLRQWHKDDPVSPDEIERNNKIERVQGNRNPFIDNPDLVDQIPTFQ